MQIHPHDLPTHIHFTHRGLLRCGSEHPEPASGRHRERRPRSFIASGPLFFKIIFSGQNGHFGYRVRRARVITGGRVVAFTTGVRRRVRLTGPATNGHNRFSGQSEDTVLGYSGLWMVSRLHP